MPRSGQSAARARPFTIEERGIVSRPRRVFFLRAFLRPESVLQPTLCDGPAASIGESRRESRQPRAVSLSRRSPAALSGWVEGRDTTKPVVACVVAGEASTRFLCANCELHVSSTGQRLHLAPRPLLLARVSSSLPVISAFDSLHCREPCSPAWHRLCVARLQLAALCTRAAYLLTFLSPTPPLQKMRRERPSAPAAGASR